MERSVEEKIRQHRDIFKKIFVESRLKHPREYESHARNRKDVLDTIRLYLKYSSLAFISIVLCSFFHWNYSHFRFGIDDWALKVIEVAFPTHAVILFYWVVKYYFPNK